jgi:hypothetical protein
MFGKIIRKIVFGEMIRKIVDEGLNKPDFFNLSYQTFSCIKCGKTFDTEKGCLIHIGAKHRNIKRIKKVTQ